MKFERKEMEELLSISTRNVQLLNNAIKHFSAVADLPDVKKEKQTSILYERRIAKLGRLKKEEEFWANAYKTALSNSKV